MQAKDALLGFAVTYRDSHADQVFGFLPCPDADNNGLIDASCGLTDVSAVGRLPWQSLGLPALRDADSECLWYAVSGSAKDTPKTAVFNWDTLGQFIVQDAAGTTTLAGTNAHERPLAMVFSPRVPITTQSRTPAGTTECGGNNASSNYLDALAALGTGTTIVKLSTADSIRNASNNDQALWITSKEVFDRVKKRIDFKSDIDALLDDITLCLNNLPLTGIPPNVLPATSAINKGVGDYPTPGLDTDLNDVLTICKPASVQKQNVMINWQDNLLYTKPGAASSLNGETGCNAILFFSGTRQGAQSRATPTQKADPTNYLEGSNLALFPGYGAYTSPLSFDGLTNSGANSSFDIARCIKGLPVGSTQKSFAADFSNFAVAGTSGGAAVTPDAINQTVAITDASGTGNGCFWFPTAIPLVTKTLRAYYEFQFFYTDKFALGDLTFQDRGNGFTFQMLRGDVGAPNATACGTESAMGALGSSDVWGSFSFIIETGVHQDSSKSDSTENHTAIMTNGSLTHAAGTVTTACNGTDRGCRHSPANKFEESPTPLAHNQRIEINTGCNLGCAICNPASTNTYARVSAWVDCTDCTNISTNLDRTTKPPTITYCTTTPLSTPEMNSIYFGFTGGFRSGATAGEAPAQGVTIKRFSIRSD